jgi:hypothetical protein
MALADHIRKLLFSETTVVATAFATSSAGST